MGSSLFYRCANLKKVVLPNTLEKIGIQAFMDCTSLKEITLPNSVTNIGYGLFYGCSSLESAKLSESLLHISDRLFQGCTSLKDVNIPESVTYFGTHAFYNTRIKKVTIPDLVTEVGSYAFILCDSLKSVSIGRSVEKIGSNAISMASIEEILSYNSVPPVADSFCFTNCNKSIPVYIPQGSLAAYQQAAEWKEFTNFIETDFVGVESNCKDASINTFISGGKLIIKGVAVPIKVTVYDLSGTVVFNKIVISDEELDITNLPKGAYIIRTDNKATKVVI